MIDKKKIIAIVTFFALSLLTITYASGRSNLLLYVVFMDSYDESVISEQKVEDGKEAIVPEDPYHKDYVFAGWYLYGEENTRITDFSNITTDLKVEARYKTDLNNNGIPDEEDEFYTIRFVDGITSEILKMQTVLAGMNASSPNPNYHEGYVFEGWDKSYSSVQNDITVTSIYTNPNALALNEESYSTLNFYDKELTIFESQTIKNGLIGTTINNIPLYEGYTLVGWFEEQNGNGQEYLVGSTINNNKELYGYWNKIKYNITINTSGGVLSEGTTKNVLEHETEFILPNISRSYEITFNPDGGVLDPIDEVVLVEAPFLGYCKDKTSCTNEELIPSGTKVIVNGHATYNAVWGTSNEIELPNVTKDPSVSTNYEFIGWSTSETGNVKYNPLEKIKVNDNLELYSKYTETLREYTFDIELNKGSFVDNTFINNESFEYGTKKTLPNLTREYSIKYNTLNDETLNGENIQYVDATLLGYCKNKQTCTNEELILSGTEITIDGISTYYAVWGESINKVNLLGAAKANSISSKYTLLGWALSSNGEVEYTVPGSINVNDDLDLYSKYTESLRKYDVNIDFNGGTIKGETDYLELDYGSEYVLPDATKNHKLTFDTNGGTLVSGETIVESEASLLGYKLNDETSIIPVGTKINVNPSNKYTAVWGKTKNAITLPTVQKEENDAGSYEFAGWSNILNGTVTNTVPGTIKISEDTTLYAAYTITLKEYKITFDANGGTLAPGTIASEVYDYSSEIVLPTATRDYTLTYNTNGGTLANSETSVKVKASFMGWCEGVKTCQTPITDKLLVTKEAVYYAVWGNALTPIKLPNVLKESSETETYTFTYWRGNATLPFKANSKMVLTTDTTLNAYYKASPRKYTVDFKSAFGSLPNSESVRYGSTVTDPGNLVSEDKEFLGWYTSMDADTKWNFETDTIIKDTTLYGIWNISSYSVSYVTNGGVLETDNSGIYEKSSEIYLPNISKEYKINYIVNGGLLENLEVSANVTFKGWCKNKTICLDSELILSNSKEIIEENIIYYAIWEEESEIVTLPVPTKLSTETEDYTFLNWSDGINNYETSIKITKDTSLTANYLTTERKYTVNFEGEYGTKPNSQLVSYEQTVNNPGTLESEGYIFDGWYKDEARTVLWDFETDIITSDTIIYAKWIK